MRSRVRADTRDTSRLEEALRRMEAPGCRREARPSACVVRRRGSGVDRTRSGLRLARGDPVPSKRTTRSQDWPDARPTTASDRDQKTNDLLYFRWSDPKSLRCVLSPGPRRLTYKRFSEYTSYMHTKLTLRIDDRLVRRAKRLAARRAKSVSQLVSGYFEALDRPASPEVPELPPLTRRLRGALRGARIEERDYLRYLEEKHR
jgi:hypothetical protein